MFKKINKKKLIFLILPFLILLWFLVWLFDVREKKLHRSAIVFEERKKMQIEQISGTKYNDIIYSDADSQGNVYRYARELEMETLIQGIKFPKGSKIEFDSSGRIEKVTLPEELKEIEIQGIKCTGNEDYYKGYKSIEFYKSGRLKGALLAENQVIQGIEIPKGLMVWFYESGKLKGIDLAIVAYFYESGKVERKFRRIKFIRDETLQIQGIKCGKRILSRDWLAMDGDVVFYESGKLQNAALAQDQEIQGIRFPNLTEINFYEFGGLKSARLSQAQEIQGIKCAKGFGCVDGDVEFYESGKLKRVGCLSENQEIRGNKLYKGDEVYFDEKGNISSFTLKENTVIQGITFPKGSRVSFYGSGKLRRASPSEDVEIQGIKFPKWSAISFYESGELKAVIIYRKCKIKGKRYPKESMLIFDENGNVNSVISGNAITGDIIESIEKKRER